MSLEVLRGSVSMPPPYPVPVCRRNEDETAEAFLSGPLTVTPCGRNVDAVKGTRGLVGGVLVALVACGTGSGLPERPLASDQANTPLESPRIVPPVEAGRSSSGASPAAPPPGVGCQKLKAVEVAGVVGFHKQRRASELGNELDDARAASMGVGSVVRRRIFSEEELVTVCVIWSQFAFGSPAPGISGRFEGYALTLRRSNGEDLGPVVFSTNRWVFPPDQRVDGIIEQASLIYDERAAAYAYRLATASPDEPGLLP